MAVLPAGRPLSLSAEEIMQYGLFEQRPLHFESLEALLAAMVDMQDDPLASAGTTLVIYRGNPEARLMIVGEAPGPQENRLGKPFVGKSGQLLDQILQAAGFDPEEEVFITNAVYRMPPGDEGKEFRKPTTEEIEFYKPYLLEMIRLIDPAVILLSGNVATQSLLGQTGITRLRGNWHQLEDRWVMPIYHPAYLLRNPSREPGSPKAQMWKDIQAARRVYDEVVGERPSR
jgi:uracil-DNA glycosylase